ncbi:SPFH domain-containing protein [Solitalea canadensis]|uniref:Membrane protease subunit, stomatin/prohibitin n=1 Tax=Solitalea canadensis (strain ATCC 29591 / DSM 3403 / JCM 21819 / LMG 8368 / NBRC 15130 / NCIMB 12057 / USAM 9D) TaxID=929556 RepID=H8KWS3_SOLCM|nr:SPFH domain-containing protein [Solitalea canadensis]AFD08252.1 membrane protease subunit, stomatin/prohibitin [Solitalea canadensis DSM 3403]
MNEKIIKPIPGFAMLGFAVLCLIGSAFSFYSAYVFIGVVLIIVALISFMGIIIINPNESRVLTFFGIYSGTVKANGLFFVNPLYKKQSISLRARNLNGQSLKVNDKMGNPIEIAAVIVWQVEDTAKAAFAVDNYTLYVNIQSEAAVRHLAGSCPYDNLEDENATITLRDGADKVNDMLEHELNERLRPAGITVLEARISHLAYAPEIAGAMLQRQQATAVVAARKQIVEGAVGMVEMALARLSEREIVHLDEERKAAMVSNLLVVLCAEKAVSPIVNTGTLYN